MIHHVLSLVRRLRASVIVCVSLPFALSAPLMAQPLDIPSDVSIPRLSGAPSLDDFAGMTPATALATEMSRVDAFVQREPTDGAAPSQRTEVYLGYDSRTLYAVFLAFDSNPELIRANLASRGNIGGDDTVELTLDTFSDQRTAYNFRVSPLGIQRDARWTESASMRAGFDTTWDAVWYTDGRLTDQGYMVSITIPLAGLRFPEREEQAWRIQLGRQIPRLSEEVYWPAYSTRIAGRLNQTAALVGLQGVSPGNNMQIIPYVFARNVNALDANAAGGPRIRGDNEYELGVDAKFVMRDSWVLDLTLNPDFSQVESDQPQVTVNQRFEVQFPERRPFFVENADFFATDSTLVFTRRIVDPEAGLRFTGRQDNWGFGAILMNDQAPGLNRAADDPMRGEKANIGVVRAFRDLGGQNRLGFLYTDRQLADGFNRVSSVDGRYRLNNNWVTTAQLVHTDTRPATGGQSITGVQRNLSFDRSGRTFSTHIHWLDTDRDFRTQLGFQNRFFRADTKGVHANGSLRFYPEDTALNNWGLSGMVVHLNDKAGVKIYSSVSPTLSFNFPASRVTAGVNRASEVLRPQDFAGLQQTTRYDYDTWNLGYRNDVLSTLSVDLRYRQGTALNLVPPVGHLPFVADTSRTDISLLWRPLQRLNIDNTYLNTYLETDRGVKVFRNEIMRSSWNYQFTREMSLRFIAQYEETDAGPATRLRNRRNMNMDVLLRYVINPWSALYVGYNNNSSNFDIVETHGERELVASDSLKRDGDQFFVKFSYLMQR